MDELLIGDSVVMVNDDANHLGRIVAAYRIGDSETLAVRFDGGVVRLFSEVELMPVHMIQWESRHERLVKEKKVA